MGGSPEGVGSRAMGQGEARTAATVAETLAQAAFAAGNASS